NSFSPGWGTIDILGTNPPTVNFDYSISDATVQFTDESTDPDGVVAWCWDFGDGYRSSEQNPVHTYATSGTYSVTLIAMDNYGAAEIKTKQVEITVVEGFFDTGPGTYPSIAGTHIGTIIPNQDITVQKMYTYPCTGTGGHTEYVAFYHSDGAKLAEEHWAGYTGEWHNISFDPAFTLLAGETYNYSIRTGSYPQIVHEQSKEVTGGTITCTLFVDVNGKTYTDWIPAIRLE
ncbi:MAG: PKD domain-containing protein, partial [Methanophagales archaeon]|nr:PKD domain-containing protein [Methanophagales archaeon]